MGIMALRAPAPTLPEAGTRLAVPMSNLRAFGLGFLTNALNPKPILFFLSLFSALVSHQTPALVKGGYGLVMAACLILWFSAVSCFLTMPKVRNAFSRAGLWINRVTGAVFIAFGIRLALSRAE